METDKVVCTECGVTTNIKNVDKHMKTLHSAEANEKKLRLQIQKEAKRLRKLQDGKKIIKCEICGVSLASRNLAKHKRKQHSPDSKFAYPKTREILKNLKLNNKKEEELKKHLKKYPDSTMAHMSNAQKRKHLNRMFGPDDNKTSDIFDKGKVSSGGAYGLGKNRKN